MRKDIASSLGQRVALIRKYTNLPIAVGFGVSTSDQVREVSANCDAVVVGSAIVSQIAEHGNDSEMPTQLGEFVKGLASGLK